MGSPAISGLGCTPQRMRRTSAPHSIQASANTSATTMTTAAAVRSKGIASGVTGTRGAGTIPTSPSR